jgi:hypothetical protein
LPPKQEHRFQVVGLGTEDAAHRALAVHHQVGRVLHVALTGKQLLLAILAEHQSSSPLVMLRYCWPTSAPMATQVEIAAMK